ncbi:DUF4416 family protein [Pseudodesulfovibrio sp. JC047]|uniref:DUF4416 family protein n=1 Tax=Pseudodesulfovibrio sp. JC047 TaxID=2683199 RepID=UPI0013D4FAD7|nr:DUF4416 family protein [Pseudodesulfovibrio sp. JC047]NDV18003.1 DUF4416 family protein [Pseudodesulfovibrio sp. JC047]
MSTPKTPEPGLLILSILSAQWDTVWPELLALLEAEFGPVAEAGDLFVFDQTDYYDAELGTPIMRRLISFETLRPLDTLADIKMATNALEQRFADGEKRRFNLDPGFITLQSLVLATGKNFSHRIYLKNGIWADLTMIWQKKQWVTFPWTFPDYAGNDMKSRLTKLRQSYKHTLSKPQM